jgi:hypothetical protein
VGISLLGKRAKRDWTGVGIEIGEAVLQAVALGPEGISSAISAVLRAVRGLRGEDAVEMRARVLVLETLGFAITATIAATPLSTRPNKVEIQRIFEQLIAYGEELIRSDGPILERENLEHPGSFRFFTDFFTSIPPQLQIFGLRESDESIKARFLTYVTQGVVQIRSRDPDYFFPVIVALSGPDVVADLRSRAWQRYRALLIKRFEDEPLFGEDSKKGATLAQVYQPLRGWWDLTDEIRSEVATPANKSTVGATSKIKRHFGMLDDLILEWLGTNDVIDRVRLISGGPGSGKSTFAKQLAAKLAQESKWRTLLVPLQRLKGSGPLENRINDYFRLQLDEPFDTETLPLIDLGRDGIADWVVIFDGLDELAKEGSNSESAAQDFASALADWRGRLGGMAVRFIVLGRAPSMQEARRRLGLHGRGTVNVADMLPYDKSAPHLPNVQLSDPQKLAAKDQRPEFWKRWAAAKMLSPEPPKAFCVDELSDLTKEPLLAYLLILSGYASDRWPEAAENRNRIYQAIFDQIWHRERTKPARMFLNDLGREGFDLLMQALGLAAWRGGGRTGDSATFTAVRDTFIRQDLLTKAKALGAADLGNVALLFYTRKDEEGGQGYEFLHKSFGEYLTARGLFGAFRRWGNQVADPTLDFDADEFLRRWLTLTGPTSITSEIIGFLVNEVRLQSFDQSNSAPWEAARMWIRTCETLVDAMVRIGLPAHEVARLWRVAELHESNAEMALMAVLNALALTAYPEHLFNYDGAGAWGAGPVKISVFEDDRDSFAVFVARLSTGQATGYLSPSGYATIGPDGLIFQLVSRLSLRGVNLACRSFLGTEFEGSNFERANLLGATLVQCNLSLSNFQHAGLEHVNFENSVLSGADFRESKLDHAIFIKRQFQDALVDKPFRPSAPLRERTRSGRRAKRQS